MSPHTNLSSAPAALNGTNDIRDIKAPVEIPSGWEWLWWLGGILAVAALCWWIWRRWKKRKTAPAPAVVIPADERARHALQQALALIFQPRPFCIAVSDVVRTYVEERFRFHAPERTTEEFLDELQASALLTFDQKLTLGEFLQRCDLVKFARYEPGEAELRQLYEAALRLVDETAPPTVVQEAGTPP